MMRHTKEETTIDNRTITIYSEPNADALLLQAVDSHDMEEMEKEISYLENALDTTFTIVAIKIRRWNEELTPWTALCLREDTVRQWGFIDLGLYNGESHPGNETEKEFQVGNPWRLFTFRTVRPLVLV